MTTTAGARRSCGAGAATAIGYDGNDRVSRLMRNFAATANDVAWTPTYSYAPSPQAVGVGSTNDAYAWRGATASRGHSRICWRVRAMSNSIRRARG